MDTDDLPARRARTIALAVHTLHDNLPALAAQTARERDLDDDDTSLLHALMEEISISDVLAAVVEAAHRLTYQAVDGVTGETVQFRPVREKPAPDLGFDDLDTAAPDFPARVLDAIEAHYGTTSPHKLRAEDAALVHVHAAEQLRDGVQRGAGR